MNNSKLISKKPALKTREFMDAVLHLHPKLAVFDCDGTLWDGDAGERFFDWELKHELFSESLTRAIRSRYVDYKAGKVSEDDMCGEMVTLHDGWLEADVRRLAVQFFEENFVQRIFPEMRELVESLQEDECEIWAVSSTNEWVIRAAVKHFDIPEDNVLAASVQIDEGTITDRLTRVPSGPGKPRAIRDVIQRIPDAAFGNSRWDVDMLKMARYPFVINPNPDLEEAARNLKWPIYFPGIPSPD